MKLFVVKIVCKNGDIGYFKNDEHIVSSKDQALKCEFNYMKGLCRGINFAINTYEDEFVSHAEIEEVEDAK